ncbi:hypothetical protein K466DRAFT_605123 [Polyporus arcularius HHB13444]|uniref:Restriction of telomere capping protein 4 C-terminal domain-containing protein n=1 Tax=Polyporus arcularius HHB13444 TaxID=1314778 RepID=A0A5C3NT52_9APHY|nr:hypothetical protein K466DRAFT_605123 [Polyporus arcularius HHB13444]
MALSVARVGFFGKQGEAIILSIIQHVLPAWELEVLADAYNPLPEDAFRRLILVPEVATIKLKKQHDMKTAKGLVGVQSALLGALTTQDQGSITPSAVQRAAAPSSSGTTVYPASVPMTGTPAVSNARPGDTEEKRQSHPQPKLVNKNKLIEEKKPEKKAAADSLRMLSLTDFPSPAPPIGQARGRKHS